MDPNFSFQYIYYDIDGQFLYDFVLLPKDYDIFSFWNKLSKEMRIQTEDKLRLDSIAEQQMREEKILADRDLERYKRTHRNLFCEETKYMPKEGVI